MADAGPDPLLEEVAGLLRVATADHGDAALDANVHKVLSVLRSKMNMDVVFVSKFENGQRAFKLVDTAPGRDIIRAGEGHPLEDSWCHHILAGRLPQLIKDGVPFVEAGMAPASGAGIRTHLSVPIVLKDGTVYGTLCTFAFHVEQGVSLHDIWRLRAAADLIAGRIQPPGS
jgi:hypothetical protein